MTKWEMTECICCHRPFHSYLLNKWVGDDSICTECLCALYGFVNQERKAQEKLRGEREIEPKLFSPWRPVSLLPPSKHLVKVLLLGGDVTAGFLRDGEWIVFEESELDMMYSKSVAGWMEL